MTSYRTQSANVLNDTDSFERKLDWMLFAQEQDARLWSDPTDWRPGDPILEHPVVRNHRTERRGVDTVWDHREYEPGPLGNAVRPMFEVFDAHDDAMDSYNRIRCEDCQVYFGAGENECFVCYKEVAPLNARQTLGKSPMDLVWHSLYGRSPIGRVDNIDEDGGGLRVQVSMSDNIVANEILCTAEARRDGELVASVRHHVNREHLVREADLVRNFMYSELQRRLDEVLGRAGPF